MNIKVGVRVRPFNQRQQSISSKLCINMIGNATRLHDEARVRDFEFDYSLWSHDNFIVDEEGQFEGSDIRYVDQKGVFEQIGMEIVDNAWEGYNCGLFAYGQTGAGKSYTLMGQGANRGILPRLCEQVFARIQQAQINGIEYQVSLSMLEIYQERVYDLFTPPPQRSKQSHKIRQNKTFGIYVEGLSKHRIYSLDEISQKLEQATIIRAIATTQMNYKSNRAHTVTTIEFKQKMKGINKESLEKTAVINVVDLAGSQRIGTTGATGDRLRQAASIGRTLSGFGRVIRALTDKARGRKVVVPYRDSSLTRILQNYLGGNSKTFMICAISPAIDNYDQTLSTLRYGDQAKRIQNRPMINESSIEYSVSCLERSIQQLKKTMSNFQQLQRQEYTAMQFKYFKKDAEIQLKFLQQRYRNFVNYQNTKKQYRLFQKKIIFKLRLTNLHLDPQLNKKIVYNIDKEYITIGKKGVEPANDIQIDGVGIKSSHALIKNRQDNYFIIPIEKEYATIYLNGSLVTKQEQIYHLDRIIFGAKHIFLAIIPDKEGRGNIHQNYINWSYARRQLQFLSIQNQEKEQKLKQERVEKSIKLTNEDKQNIVNQQYDFAGKLFDINQHCLQLNSITKSLNKNISLSVKILIEYQQNGLQTHTNKVIKINILNRQLGIMYMWDVDRFYSQYKKIKSFYQQFCEKGFPNLCQNSNRDSLWNPLSLTLIGKAFLNIKPIIYLFDNYQMLGMLGQDMDGEMLRGAIEVNIIPTDETGTRNLSQEIVDQGRLFSPEQLLQHPLYYLVEVKCVQFQKYHRDVKVFYTIKNSQLEDEKYHINLTFHHAVTKIIANYKKLHKFQKVTQQVLYYLTTAKIKFQIYAFELTNQQAARNHQFN